MSPAGATTAASGSEYSASMDGISVPPHAAAANAGFTHVPRRGPAGMGEAPPAGAADGEGGGPPAAFAAQTAVATQSAEARQPPPRLQRAQKVAAPPQSTSVSPASAMPSKHEAGAGEAEAEAERDAVGEGDGEAVRVGVGVGVELSEGVRHSGPLLAAAALLPPALDHQVHAPVDAERFSATAKLEVVPALQDQT